MNINIYRQSTESDTIWPVLIQLQNLERFSGGLWEALHDLVWIWNN